jgi:hypothetical protein
VIGGGRPTWTIFTWHICLSTGKKRTALEKGEPRRRVRENSLFFFLGDLVVAFVVESAEVGERKRTRRFIVAEDVRGATPLLLCHLMIGFRGDRGKMKRDPGGGWGPKKV